MKKFIVVMMAAGLFGAMPALAAENDTMKMETGEGARQFALQAESIQQKIKRLQTEINKGSKKYTAEEMKKLNAKLKDANDVLEELISQ